MWQVLGNIHYPRSRPYDQATGGGGETFVLFALVTNVEQDVEEGADGIEHMSDFCIS